LLFGVQEFNSINSPVRGNIDIDFIADMAGFDTFRFLPEADVGDAVSWIIADIYSSSP